MTKRLRFAGTVVGEPWWSIGQVVSAALRDRYEVDVATDSFSHHNLEFVGSDRADVGATTPGHFAKARARTQKYADMDPIDVSQMRALAVICRPQWLAIAFAKNQPVRSLDEVRESKIPIRLLGSVEPTGALYTMLDHHGLSVEEIRSWGGSVYKWEDHDAVERGEVDVVFGRLYSGYTPHMATWYRAAMKLDLTFTEFPDKLIETWTNDGSYDRAVLPSGFLPGVDGDLHTAGTDQVVIYGKESLDDTVVTDLVRGLDEHSALLLNTRTPLWYERSRVAVRTPIPLHKAAERYYASVGYIDR